MSRIMAHLVAHYPDPERSLAVAGGLVDGGASYLEVQFPFSDPTADGPVIQHACKYALDAGFSVDAGFDFVRAVAAVTTAAATATEEATAAEEATAGAGGPRAVPIFIMSYASLLFARGVRRFLEDGARAGAAGFILPDLPLDYDEGVVAAAREVGTTIVPVTVTSAREARIALLLESRPEYVYVALRSGITGAKTELGEENLRFLDRLRDAGARIMAGFGVSERAQVEALDPHVHATVVGSAFVRTVTAHANEQPEQLRAHIAAQARTLVGEAPGAS